VLYLAVYGQLFTTIKTLSAGSWRPQCRAWVGLARAFDLAYLLATAFLVSGACGIPVRLFILVSAAFDDPETGRQFRRLFPFLFLLDEVWATAPLLLIGKWAPGLTIICVALMRTCQFPEKPHPERIFLRRLRPGRQNRLTDRRKLLITLT